MCGRFNLIDNGEQVAIHFGLTDVPAQMVPRFNIAPTQPVAAVRHNLRGQRELSHFHWGLIPSWAKDPKFAARMINARSETAAEKPAYRNAYKRRRCLVPITGFYEWQKITPRKKQPMHIYMESAEIFAVAGLWESWQGIESCTVLTTRPNHFMAPIHDRMPVILKPSDYDLWLDKHTPLPALKRLFEPYSAEAMRAYPITTYVNKAGNEGPDCIAPLAS